MVIVLRDPWARSPLTEFKSGTSFQPILKYFSALKPEKANLTIFCSGRYVYNIMKHLASKHLKKIGQISLVTVEELLPFPEEIISKHLSNYKKKSKIIWMQDESMNTGAYSYVRPRFNRILSDLNFKDQ